MPKDFRYNPWSDSVEAVSLTELYQVPAVSPYTIRLNEVPEVGDPSTMVVKEVTAISGVTRTYGSTFTEVAAVPASESFRPDYNTGAAGDDDWNTGTLLFAAADAGKLVEVTYNGLGTLASVKAPSYPAWFTDRGDGSDGDYAPTESTTLAGGTYNFKSVNIPSGVTITLTGCVEIKCLGAFVCLGIITANGNFDNAGSGGTNGANGGVGGSRVAGGVGGAGGSAADNKGYGGAGGADNLWLSGKMPTSNLNYVLSNKLPISGSGGGGGGSYGSGRAGGSGGKGGGSIYIIANSVSVYGSITANGTNGLVSDSIAGTGGGGGGGGVVIIANSISNTGTITATGGLSSSGSYRGAAGSDGLVYLKELGAV